MLILLFLAAAHSQSSYQRSQIQGLTARFDVSWLELGSNSIKSSKLSNAFYKLSNEHENTNNHLRKLLATDSSWEANDQMRVDLVGDGMSMTNFVWTTSSSSGLFKQGMFSGGSVSASGGTYFTITCFYPNALITDTRKQNGEVKMKALDFMFGQSSTIRSSTDTVTVTLSRKMARLYLTIHFGTTQITSQTLSEYTLYISGIKHDGNYYTDGRAAANSDAAIVNDWDISNICNASTASQTIGCKMILFPQTLTNGITLSVVRNGQSVGEAIQINSLESGYIYNCDITMDSITFTKSNTFSNSNTFSQSDTFTQSNTFSNSFTQSHTFSHTFSKSNAFTQSHTFSHTFSKSNAFTASLQSGVTFIKTLISKYSITQTMISISIFTNTMSVTFFNSTYYYIYSNFISYEYIIYQYSTYYIYYSHFFSKFENETIENDNKITKNVIIGVICCSILIILIIIGMIIFLFRRNRTRNLHSNSSSKTETSKSSTTKQQQIEFINEEFREIVHNENDQWI